jgi:putative DNA primase/helicase
LAFLIHLADQGINPVGLGATERACAWADYLESHARRVYRPQWSELTTRDDAPKAVDILVDLDSLRERAKEQTGGRPRQRFEINPCVKEIG